MSASNTPYFIGTVFGALNKVNIYVWWMRLSYTILTTLYAVNTRILLRGLQYLVLL